MPGPRASTSLTKTWHSHKRPRSKINWNAEHPNLFIIKAGIIGRRPIKKVEPNRWSPKTNKRKGRTYQECQTGNHRERRNYFNAQEWKRVNHQ